MGAAVLLLAVRPKGKESVQLACILVCTGGRPAPQNSVCCLTSMQASGSLAWPEAPPFTAHERHAPTHPKRSRSAAPSHASPALPQHGGCTPRLPNLTCKQSPRGGEGARGGGGNSRRHAAPPYATLPQVPPLSTRQAHCPPPLADTAAPCPRSDICTAACFARPLLPCALPRGTSRDVRCALLKAATWLTWALQRRSAPSRHVSPAIRQHL